ncbi:MAG: hypothetical protein H6621_06615 [Halobacteriovoraceae bacterium]|nr:hypothetical protein [Halobacteriovoraceae bacterium]
MSKKILSLFVSLIILSTSALAGSEYEKVTQKLKELHSANPNVSELFVLGKNDQDQDIMGITIRLGGNERTTTNDALVVGTHHGNEKGSTDVALAFAENVLKRKTYRLKGKTLYVIPVLNISGYNVSERHEKNSKGEWLDANRDYPDPCRPRKESFELKSTAALKDFIEDHKKISTAITIHGYIGTLTFPWGTYTENTSSYDHAKFLKLAEEAAEMNDYQVGTHADVIYPAVGAFEDWTYWHYGIWALLVEVDYQYDRLKDAEAIEKFITYAPTRRSTRHSHKGPCKLVRGDNSRP